MSEIKQSSREEILAELTGPGGPFEIVTAEVGGVRQKIYASAPASMRDVLLGTRTFGANELLVYQDDRWTFEEHFRRVAALAHLFTERGIRRGDRVAIGMRNYPEWAQAFWACQAIGAVAVTLNAWWTGEELQYALADSAARAAVLDGERLQRLEPYLDTVPVEMVLGVREAAGSVRAELLDYVIAPYEQNPGLTGTLPEVELEADAPSTIMYTSGTTDRPKGAVATHRNHVTNLWNSMLAAVMGARLAAADQPAAPSEEAPQPVALQTFPFFHIGGLTGLYVLTAMGAKIVLMYRWDAGEALRLVEAEGVRSLSGVPTVVRQLLERAKEEGRELPTLGGIASGGAPVPPDLIDTIGSQFSQRVAPGNGYGLTETTSAVITNGGADYFARPHSVGRPVPVAEVRVVGDDGGLGEAADVAEGEIGELWVKGPNIVRGYWNKPEATAESFTDGWFHTGDLGYRDADGFYYVVDRKKDVVIRGGENVYCAEVEAVLFLHPDVQDVAVIGMPHRELGEEVAAVIEPRPGHSIDDNDVQGFVAARLARFKVPSRIFVIDEPLPRTATGKVLKRELKDRYAAP